MGNDPAGQARTCEYELLYSGSRDGWTEAAFQATIVDAPTITVAYSYRDAIWRG
ncbi:hypothetical protein T484DRAFT_1840230 [Baffinella frigidus]|nr:hypothetical protein T484DRAFT_1840230 [Cryptophyta sp. CCMP2293]